MDNMLNRYQTLEKKHGTYRQFEDAVWNTLGECSVVEIQAACASYREDLAKARLADLAVSPRGQQLSKEATDEPLTSFQK